MNARVSRSSALSPRRRPGSRSPRSPRGSPSATRSRRSPTTSPRRRRRRSSRRSTTWSRRCRGSRSRSSPGAEGRLSTHMKSVGEVMAIGRASASGSPAMSLRRELDSAASLPEDTDELLRRLEPPPRTASTSSWRRSGAGSSRPRSAPDIDRPLVPRRLRALAVDGDGTAELVRSFRSVDTCAAEFEARTPYCSRPSERPSRNPAAAGAKSGGETARRS